MSHLHIICRIADSEYAIPASDVVQMESFGEITPVPGSPSYVAGLIQVRQQVIPVVDARLRFGLAPAAPTESSRFVILKLGERQVAILVDCAREVRNFEPADFQDSPAMSSQAGGFVKSVAQLKNRIIMLMDAHRVVGEEVSNG